MLRVDKLCLGRILPIHSQLQVLSWGELILLSFSFTLRGVNITGMRAEDMTMALHRDFSTLVSVGEGACGGLVDRVLFQTMRCLVSFD